MSVPARALRHGQPGKLAITILRPAGETSIGAGWHHHAPGGRLRLTENLDKPAHRHRNDEPQNYKGKSPGTNEYRSDSFHHAPIVVTSICPQSPPPVRLTPGTLASSGGAKVLFIRGLKTPDQPQSCPSRAARQAGLTKLRATIRRSAGAYAG